jgi:hypothetical protein
MIVTGRVLRGGSVAWWLAARSDRVCSRLTSGSAQKQPQLQHAPLQLSAFELPTGNTVAVAVAVSSRRQKLGPARLSLNYDRKKAAWLQE